MSTAEAWTVGRLLTWTADYLKKHGSTSPRLDAEVLLAEARGCQRIELYTAFAEEPSEEVRASFKEMVRRRAEGTPVAYLVGRKEFFSLPFEINPDVLIPRPETEHLVVEAVDRAKKITGQGPGSEPTAAALQPHAATTKQPTADDVSAHEPAASPTDLNDDEAAAALQAGQGGFRPRPSKSFAQLTIADIGTGSGAVAVSLAKSLPGAQIIALDISPAALQLAGRNVERHAVAAQISLVESDLLAAVAGKQFDMIVSNPPYVTEAEYAQLPTSVRNYEPRTALVGGVSGTEIIARLIVQAATQLRTGGWLLMEISPTIADGVVALLDRKLWSEPTLTKDLAGHARIVCACRL